MKQIIALEGNSPSDPGHSDSAAALLSAIGPIPEERS